MHHELDLHNYTVDEALNLFREQYNRRCAGPGESLKVIHGYGASGTGGSIRRKLRALLQNSTESLRWIPGENIDGNEGYTVVYPGKPLPTPGNLLEAEILAYCAIPRPEEKIAGKFHRATLREVKEALRRLRQQDQLVELIKAGRTCYIRREE